MQFGVVYPQNETESSRASVAHFARIVEALGYRHVLAYDHVLGANPDRPGGWRGPYTYQDAFLEPLVLYSFMTAVTRRLGFVTGIIIAPQRETALLAKQAATLDVLCQGRLRLGLGVGWNRVEYEALGQDFHQRGRRLDEQVELLRRLWTEPLLHFDGDFHVVSDAGLNPLPLQRPIPRWFGGHSESALARIARVGDGWIPTYAYPRDAAPALAKLDDFLAQHGRRRSDLGLEVMIRARHHEPAEWPDLAAAWAEVGATHLAFNTLGAGFARPAEHLSAMAAFARAVGLEPE